MRDDNEEAAGAAGQFKVWRSVPLGKYTNSADNLVSLESQGFMIGRVVRSVLRKTPIQYSAGMANIVRVTGPELGIEGHVPLQRFYDVYQKFGLKLCRPEVALALREQYADQPRGEVLWVVSPRLVQSKHESGVMCLWNVESGKWLSFGCGNGCAWGRWRLANFTPETQDRIVPRWLCECPWSLAPITAVFEV